MAFDRRMLDNQARLNAVRNLAGQPKPPYQFQPMPISKPTPKPYDYFMGAPPGVEGRPLIQPMPISKPTPKAWDSIPGYKLNTEPPKSNAPVQNLDAQNKQRERLMKEGVLNRVSNNSQNVIQKASNMNQPKPIMPMSTRR